MKIKKILNYKDLCSNKITSILIPCTRYYDEYEFDIELTEEGKNVTHVYQLLPNNSDLDELLTESKTFEKEDLNQQFDNLEYFEQVEFDEIDTICFEGELYYIFDIPCAFYQRIFYDSPGPMIVAIEE